MADMAEVMAVIENLNADDSTERQSAQDTLKAMGDEAIPFLNRAAGQRNRYPYVEVYRMLGIIGDECNPASRKSLIKTMQRFARSTSSHTPEEVKEIAREALKRWGEEVPEPTPSKVHHCHQCNRPSTEINIRICFLPECKKPVCEEHAAIITGGMGTWFCSEEHKQKAMKNPSNLM